MTEPKQDDLLQALRTVNEPDLGVDLVTLDMISGLSANEAGKVALRLSLSAPNDPAAEEICAAVVAALSAVDGVTDVDVEADFVVTASGLPNAERLGAVHNIIGVGAGKGGVGKTTVAVNLAVALAAAGARVGLLDADIYGPSVPIMLGAVGEAARVDGNGKILPIEAHGIRFMSMGLLVKAEDAVVWRGPMIGRAVSQFVDDVAWGELDYLIVDLPPGTGDVVLSLSQTIPMSGALVVATPQDVAFADVTRAVRMFRMLKVELLGLVENMSYFLCPDNGKKYAIFGESRTANHCAEQDLILLGSLPLDMAVSPNADRGQPIATAEPDSAQAQHWAAIAGRVAKRQAVLNYLRSGATGRHDEFFAAVPEH